jgi:hypothetical protein
VSTASEGHDIIYFIISSMLLISSMFFLGVFVAILVCCMSRVKHFIWLVTGLLYVSKIFHVDILVVYKKKIKRLLS